MFWRHSFCNKLIKEVCIEYMSAFVADASVFSFAFKIVWVCFPLPLCLFFYICTCFVFWIAISLRFREKWFVKTWKWVAKRESRIAIWNPATRIKSFWEAFFWDFYLLLGYPIANFDPLLRGQPHKHNHCISYFLRPKVIGSLVMMLEFKP